MPELQEPELASVQVAFDVSQVTAIVPGVLGVAPDVVVLVHALFCAAGAVKPAEVAAKLELAKAFASARQALSADFLVYAA